MTLPGVLHSLLLLACRQGGLQQPEKALKQRATGAEEHLASTQLS